MAPSKTDAPPPVQFQLDHDQVVQLCADRDKLAEAVKAHHSTKSNAAFNPTEWIPLAEKILAELELILGALPAGTTTLAPPAKPA